LAKKMILLDLGSEVIKAIEVEQNGISTNITRAISASGATLYLDDKGLKNMNGLVRYITETLEENGFTAKRVMISTSAFNISTTIEILDDKQTELKGLQHDNLTLSTYQIYGETQTEQGSERHYTVSSASRLPIESLAKTFKQYGYTVISIEDAKTAEMNLIKLKPWNYDIPDKIILSLGRRPYLYGFTQDALSFVEPLTPFFTQGLEKFAKTLDCEFEQFRDIFTAVGIERSSSGMAILQSANINADSYYSSVKKFCVDAFEQLKKQLDYINEDHRVNHYYLIISGGFADIPGVYPLIEEEFNDEATTIIRGAIGRRYSDKYMTIENKLAGRVEDIGCIYGNCIGLIFKSRFGTKSNLLPLVKEKPKSGFLLIATTRVIIAIVILLSVSSAFKTVLNLINYVSFPEITNAAEINAEYQSLLSREKSLSNRLKAIKTIDKTAIKLIEFAGNYKDPMLSIVSIDTQDMLEAENAKEVITEEKKPTSPFADVTEETEEAEEEIVDVKAIVIRGYALSSSAVSQFSSAIYDAGISDKVYVDGVEKVELPSGESLYIFQIYLEQEMEETESISESEKTEESEENS